MWITCCQSCIPGWTSNNRLKCQLPPQGNVFKDSSARRADYIQFSGDEKFALKFCAVRWTENSKVAGRAIEVYSDMAKFVKEKLKSLKHLSSVNRLTEADSDPLTMAKLAFFSSLSHSLEGFLKKYQTPGPMLPLLWDDLAALLRSVLSRCVKSSVLEQSNTVKKMLKIDLNDRSSLVVYKYVDIGIATKSILNKGKVSEKLKMDFQVKCRHICVTVAQKLTEKSQLKYKMTRAQSNRILSERRMTELILILYEAGRLRGASGDRTKAQFTSLYALAETSQDCKSWDARKDCLDQFYHKVFDPESKELKEVVKLVLILSHGNAKVESGVSVNGDLLVENMNEDSIVAQRVVYDELRAKRFDISSVEINQTMMRKVRSARTSYSQYLDMKKQTASKEQKRKAEKRKTETQDRSTHQEKRGCESPVMDILKWNWDAPHRAENSHPHRKCGCESMVQHIITRKGDVTHREWECDSPVMHILTWNWDVPHRAENVHPHRECGCESMAQHILTRKGDMTHQE